MAEVQTATPVGGFEPRPPSRSSRPSSRNNYSSRPGSHARKGSGGYASRVSAQTTATPYTGTSKERPPSVRSLQEKKELSEYLAPLVKSAVRRWKRFHEQRVLEKFKERKELKKRKIESLKEEKEKLARKIPVDTLACEWLNTNEVTVDARAYLLEKLLPTLILGIEKLLTEAERRGLTDRNESSPDFNPLNYLAQYLMRNNPRYSNFPEASPYIRGLREVTEELKTHVFSFEDNRLAKIKSEARKRREEHEKQIAMKDRERGKRSARVRAQYDEWLLDGQEVVEMQFLQTALKSFNEVVEKLPDELQQVSSVMTELEAMEKSDGKVDQEEFVNFLRKFFSDMSSDMFNELITHMSNCAASYRHAAILEARRELLLEVFESCDHAGVGLLDRHRVLSLFENFWDESAWLIKRHLRNPRKWPVVELDETDDTESMLSSEGSHMSQSLEPDHEANKVEEVEDAGSGEMVADGEEKVKSEEKDGEISDSVVAQGEGKEPLASKEGEDTKEPPTERAKSIQDEEGKSEEAGQEAAPQEGDDEKEDGQNTSVDEAGVEQAGSAAPEATEVVSDEKGEVPSVGEEEAASGDKEGPSSEETVAEAGEVQVAATEEVGAEDTTSKEPVPSQLVADEAKAQEEEVAADKEGSEQATEAVTKEEAAPPLTEAVDEGKDDKKEEVMGEVDSKESKADDEPSGADQGELKDVVQESEVKDDTQMEVTTDTVEASKDAEVTPAAIDGEAEGEVREAGGSGPQTANAGGRHTSVSFREDAIQHKEKSSKAQDKHPVKTPVTTRSGSVATSAFDENFLNQSQFVQLVEAFLGDDPSQEVIDLLVKYLKGGYVETEEEKFLRLQKARKEAMTAKRKTLFDQLFEKWDNDGSGYLDFDELMSVISKFKENMESKVVNKAKAKVADNLVDNRISQQDFKIFINEVCALLPGGEDNFDPIIEFLMTSIERSYEERIRGQARKKWLTQIIQSAWTSGANMTPVFKSMFNSLYKDADQHGRGKRISANVALLERNDTYPHRGNTCLRYVAATPDDAHFLINKCLYRDMKGISFSSVDSGKPIHVPRVQNHGNIMFWNPERNDEERQGSFIVIPLKDFKKRVFGVLGIDTLNDPQEKSIFITHEISFFQGVGKAFSQGYQYVDVRRKTLRITESAIAWIHRRSPHVEEISVYIVEPDEKEFDRKAYRRQPIKNRKMLEIFMESSSKKMDDSVLRKMMSSNRSGQITLNDSPVRLDRKENLFRDYLFKCMDNSETVTADAYGQRHTAFPLRGPDGRAVAVIDISIGDLKQLPGHENKEVQRMLKLLQSAHRELSSESEGGDKNIVLEAEKRSEESRIDIMFDRIMLTDLRDTVGKLTTRAFAELKSYKDPPKVIHDIVGSVLTLFYQDKEGDIEVWHTCKQYVNPELVKKIQEFDPTASNTVGAVEKISERLKDVPHGAVAKHGSLPAQHLYNWAFVCLSLLEHTSKSLGSSNTGGMTPVGSVHSDGPPIEQ
ncbi:EF-hand calcium-binding domain-containing protein 5 [Holothuria leucospilota]|uniref:EF-hand calcium-binding domain-containing protein 5 n=1 Tax=Holothuria leucospilota TaxID=206669 RepID=A0A9Q1CD32_HOLLE|nr:EF-hand calcium-binding domain-containing protein 5 [Holothuria leucospilota]